MYCFGCVSLLCNTILEIYSDIYLHGCQWISQLSDLDVITLQNDEFDFAFENRINLFVLTFCSVGSGVLSE